ncbi:MAG: hypothetical protein IJW97_02935, partial [Clostridia bacterium]|nr:hypothetical protein [Clostridia bacterium]
MRNFKIKIAELYITISARYDLTYEICRPYMTDLPWSDITVYVTPAQIRSKQRSMTVALSEEQAECICINEQISLKLLYHDAFLLHAAVVKYGDRAYAFCAPRGVGKTTHALLWQKQFGDTVEIINGDKPIIRRQKDGSFYAYGTPWGGKEGLHKNCGVHLDNITFIDRGTQDSIRYVTESEYLERIIGQVVFPPEQHTMERGAALLAAFM